MKELRAMPIGKVGKRRNVVIPQDICDEVGIQEGDFVEVVADNGTVVIRPKKLVDAREFRSVREHDEVTTI